MQNLRTQLERESAQRVELQRLIERSEGFLAQRQDPSNVVDHQEDGQVAKLRAECQALNELLMSQSEGGAQQLKERDTLIEQLVATTHDMERSAQDQQRTYTEGIRKLQSESASQISQL